MDLEGRCTFCNPACLQHLGYERANELLGQPMNALIHHSRADGTPHPTDECMVQRAFRTGEGIHVVDEPLWKRDGTSFPAEYWAYPQRKSDEVVGAVVAFIDITERKRAEQALRESEERFRLVANTAPVLIWMSDVTNCVLTSTSPGSTSPDAPWKPHSELAGRNQYIPRTCKGSWRRTRKPLTGGKNSRWNTGSGGMTGNIAGSWIVAAPV